MGFRVGLFGTPAFRLLWCSSLAAAGAQYMERVATGWLALEAGGGPLGVGVVFAARTLPFLLLGLPAGALADRTERRRILMGVALGGALLSLVLAALVRAGAVGLWQVAAISFLMGCVQVCDVPARQALVVDTVGRARAANAIALNSVAGRLFGAVGALAGGLAIPLLGVANSYVVVAAAYLVGLTLLAFVRVAPRVHAVATRPPFRTLIAESAQLIVQQPTVRTLVIAAMACEVFAFSFMTIVPSYARDVLLAGPEGLGALNAATSVGATVAVLILAALPSQVRREPILAMVYVVYGLALLTLGVAGSLAIATAVVLVIGACAASFDALQQTMIQLAVPEEQRGRAAGIWVFSIGTAPAGHLEAGALSALLGAQPTLLINGAFVIAGGLILALRAPEYRPRRATPIAVPIPADERADR
jgi:MFS family permease